MTRKQSLKILFVEDNPSDAELAIRELRKGGLEFEHLRVETREEFLKTLNDFKPDLIISDYMMPSYNGMKALLDAKKFAPEVPFILFTGSINEETAVECLKAGADDYIIKEHLTRLSFSVKEALIKGLGEKEKRAAGLLLKENEEKLQSIFRAAPVGIGVVVNRIFIEVNDTFCQMTGYSRKELIGKSSEMIYASHEDFVSIGVEKYRQIEEKGTGSMETRFKCKGGRIIDVLLSSTPLDKNDLMRGVTFTVMDITERKVAEIALQESEERFRNLYNDAVIGLYRTNPQGDILLANNTLIKMLGFSSFEELSKRNLNKTGFETVFKRNQFVDQIEKKGEVKDMESVWISHDGKEIFVRESAKAIYDSEGKILYYDGTVVDITEQKRTTEDLNKIQHLFETLAQVSPVGIFRTSPDGNTTYVNPKWSELSGLKPEEAIGTAWLKAVHHEDRSKLSETWMSNLKSGDESGAEYRFLRQDGSIVWVIGKAVPEMIGNEITGYIGTITEITERKQYEEALAESETKYRQLVTQSPDGIFIIDLSGKFLSVNRAICNGLKYTEEELLSTNLLDIILEKHHPMHKEGLMAMGSGKVTTSIVESEVKGKDGQSHFIEVISVPYFKGKEIAGFQGIARDISGRKLFEEELKRNRDQLINAQIIARLGSWEYDVENDTFIFNDPFYAIFRTTAEQVGGYTMKSADYAKRFVHPDDMEMVGLETRMAIETDDPNFSRQVEHRINYADGETGFVAVRFFIKKNEKGKTIRTFGVNQDITERKRVEIELKKATELMKLAKEKAEANDNLKTTFLNNISHEVRTPLNGILGFAEIISQPDLSEEEKNVSYAMLQESTDRLLDTITNYMDISLINSGTMSVHCIDFSPDNLLRELYANFRIKCLARNLELIMEIPDRSDMITISSDQEIVRKILTHLLNNAIKFTEKGLIKYGFTIRKNELEFFVKDTGIGIGEESREDVFDHFIKEDRGPHVLSEGSGLGLSIAKGLVGLLGGKITVESEIYKGSTFFFTLPAEKKSVDIVLNKDVSRQSETRKSNSILVAEDDTVNFYYIKALLQQNTTAEIIYASNGKDAVDKFKQNPDVGLILMDIKMPVMDGLEATRQIKAIKQSVPIIAVTAYAMVGDEARILNAGCDGYLIKPINKKLFLDKISDYVIMK